MDWLADFFGAADDAVADGRHGSFRAESGGAKPGALKRASSSWEQGL